LEEVKKKKRPCQGKNRVKGGETRKASEEKKTMQSGTFPIEGDKGKRRGRLSKFGQTTPSAS
jgi:hypothetical protein